MEVYEMPLAEIVPYIRNQKKHDKTQINNVAQSLRDFGWVQPVVVDKDNNIIIGHCRILAAQKLGMATAPVVKLEDLSPEEANKLRLLDNKLNESDWDLELLAEDIAELEFGDYNIDWELPEPEEEEEDIIEDEAVEPPEEPKSKLGDLYLLGEHRLLCGDSTDVEAVKRLTDGQMVDLLITDPPYNVSLGSNGGHAMRPSEAKQLHRRTDGKIIQNDSWSDEDDFIKFLVQVFEAALEVMKPGAVFYIWYADTQALNFRLACKEAGMQVRQNLIWNKSVFAMGRQDYQWKHEPCLYGWKDGASHLWASDRKQSTVIDYAKPSKSTIHPTMKPVGLFDYQIKNNTKGGDLVLDLFNGSGTTIMACEQNGRRACCMELDPGYVDAAVERYIAFKGNSDDVYLIRDGQKYHYNPDGEYNEAVAD